MTEQELRSLVERITRAVLEEKSASVAAPRGHVLFLFTAATHTAERALELVASLSAKVPVKVFAAACYTERYPIETLVKATGCPDKVFGPCAPQKREQLVQDSRAVAFLQPLMTTLAKTARGFADSPPAVMLQQALALAKPTYAAGGEADPSAWPSTMPPAMRHGAGSLGEFLDQDLRRLESWGLVYRRDPLELRAMLLAHAEGKPAPALATAAQPGKPTAASARRFITAEDVQRIHAEGKRELSVEAGSILTDLAREAAAALHVHLHEE